MIRTLLTSAFVFLVTCISAQPILTSTDLLPQVGESIGNFSFDAMGVGAGNAGANQTWDFTFLQPTGEGVSNVVLPPSTPEGSKFSNATIAVGEDSNFVYYKGSTSSLDLYGLTADGNSAVYTDPETQLVFPLTFGTTNVDNFEGKADIDIPGFGMITTFRYGTTTIEADGYGMLKLPQGNYVGVIRVKTESFQTDSVNLFIFDTIVETTVVTYQWYQGGTHVPLLTISELTTEVQPQPIYTGSYINPTVGVAELSPAFSDYSVTPNVSNGNAMVRFQVSDPGKVKISMIDLKGEEVMMISEKFCLRGSYQEEIYLGELPSGIYFVKFASGNQAVTSKVIVP